MEEKERYKLESHNGTFCDFHDTETDEWYTRKDLVTDLLNQQDKRIKELKKENQQLKQLQKQLAISELEKVEEILWDSQDIGNVIDNDKFLEKLNYLIKSLKGAEKNE